MDDCQKPARIRGWCSMHHTRWLRTGRLDLASYAERFWAKVNKDGPGGCWLWTGGVSPEGYGIAVVAKNAQGLAHRWAYETQVGPVPDGLVLDHLCRVRHCVNPEHLEPVTQAENVRRWSRTVTHCPQGHPYDDANTYIWGGKRQCRRCRNERSYARKRRLRALRDAA